jgi:DNA-binding NtrC family response regulator
MVQPVSAYSPMGGAGAAPMRGHSMMGGDAHAHPLSMPASDEGLQSSVRATEYQAIMNAIRGSTSRNEAAARLGISPRTLRYKLARLRDPMGSSMVALGEGVA